MKVLRLAAVWAAVLVLVPVGIGRASAPPRAATALSRSPVSDQINAAGHRRVTQAQLSSKAPARNLADTWAAQRLRGRHAAGSSVVLVVVFGPGGDDAVPIPDLDHDAAQEVLQARSGAAHQEVVVLSGKTGGRLWSVQGDGLIGAEYTVTPTGAGTVLVYSINARTGTDLAVGFGWHDSFVVQALDARSGRALWSQALDEVVASSPASDSWSGVESDGLLRRHNQAPLLLLDTTTCSFGVTGTACHVQPLLVDVGTGKIVGTGVPIGDDGFAWIEPVGDVDGDGTDDVANLSTGDVNVITVWSGADSHPMWTTRPSGSLVGAWSTPDISGNGHPDLLLATAGATGGAIQAVEGSGGAVLWTRHGDYAVAVGDIDHDRRSDTRVVTFAPALRYEVVTARGKTVWSRTVSNPFRGAVQPESYPGGDVNGDKIVDIYVRYTAKDAFFGPPVAALGSALLDGATGKLRRLPDLGLPLGDSADGHGDDFYRAVAGKNGLSTTLFDGATGRARWQRTVAGETRSVVDTWVGHFGSHGAVGLLSTLVYARTEAVLVQQGARGTTTWSAGYALPNPTVVAPFS